MPRLPLSGRIALGILAGFILAGCGFGDLFRAPGPADGVIFVFHSPVELVEGDTVPLVVSVSAGGKALPNPRMVITSLDTTHVRLTAANDSLIGVRRGNAELELRLEGSIITGDAPDTVQTIRVCNPASGC